MMRPPANLALAGVLLVACLFSAGCATSQLAALPSQLPATVPARSELTAVPFHPQEDYQCGPAALATTLMYSGVVTSPAALVPQVYLPARIGKGNAAYALHDLDGAEAAYREATVRHPEAADAWNNLAQALLELGRGDEAVAAAQRAVDIGGPRLALYRSTLQAASDAR